MDVVLQQLPALLGVLLGALATLVTTSLNETARWRRERHIRWDDARMRAYADYAETLKKMSFLACRVAAGRGLPHSVEPLTPDSDALSLLSEAEGVRARAWESVLLLGEPGTVEAARAWHQQIWRLEWFGRGRLTGVDQWELALREAERCRDEFYAQARRDLGVRGQMLQTRKWPPPWLSDSPSAAPENDTQRTTD